MKRTVNTRTILIIAIALSSIVVIRQNIRTQLLVSVLTALLISVRSDTRSILYKVFGRLKHFWLAILIIILIQIIFRRGGNVLTEFYLLKITDVGLFYGLSVALRLINLILIAGLLFNISSSEYLLAFKAWRVPYEISFLITTVIRFIPDYYRLFIAYRETMYLRNVNIRKLSVKNKLSALVALLIPVLTANLHEVKYRAIALDLKGFRLYPKRTYLYEAKLQSLDYLIQFLTLIGFVMLIVYL